MTETLRGSKRQRVQDQWSSSAITPASSSDMPLTVKSRLY
jgi:hypothetical protein